MIDNHTKRLNELLEQLLFISEKMLNLNSEEESFESDVEQLQEQQQVTRTEITNLVTSHNLHINHNFLERCMRAELLVYSKFEKLKSEAKTQIDNFQNGSRAKSAYQRAYQTEGVFIDRQN